MGSNRPVRAICSQVIISWSMNSQSKKKGGRTLLGMRLNSSSVRGPGNINAIEQGLPERIGVESVSYMRDSVTQSPTYGSYAQYGHRAICPLLEQAVVKVNMTTGIWSTPHDTGATV